MYNQLYLQLFYHSFFFSTRKRAGLHTNLRFNFVSFLGISFDLTDLLENFRNFDIKKSPDVQDLRGDNRIWTGDQGVADPRLTAWLCRQIGNAFALPIKWLLRESNPCYRRERAMSWPLDQGALYVKHLFRCSNSPCWTRTNDNSVNSRVLYRLS